MDCWNIDEAGRVNDMVSSPSGTVIDEPRRQDGKQNSLSQIRKQFFGSLVFVLSALQKWSGTYVVKLTSVARRRYEILRDVHWYGRERNAYW